MTMILQALVLLFLSLADVGRRPLPIFILLTHSPLGHNEPIPSYVRTPRLTYGISPIYRIW